MQSAVWSQPHTTSSSKSKNRLRQGSRNDDTPDSRSGKSVLGIGIGQSLLGGLLIVCGLTGLFVKDESKKLLGTAAIVGISSIITGVCGCKSIDWDRAISCTNYFTFLCCITSIMTLGMCVIDVYVLVLDPSLLLVKVIASSELTLAVIDFLISLMGLVVAIVDREILQHPLGGDA